jgi:hypothetical protein
VLAAAAPGGGAGQREPRASPQLFVGDGELAPRPSGGSIAPPTGRQYSPVAVKKLQVKDHLQQTAEAKMRVPTMAE